MCDSEEVQTDLKTNKKPRPHDSERSLSRSISAVNNRRVPKDKVASSSSSSSESDDSSSSRSSTSSSGSTSTSSSGSSSSKRPSSGSPDQTRSHKQEQSKNLSISTNKRHRHLNNLSAKIPSALHADTGSTPCGQHGEKQMLIERKSRSRDIEDQDKLSNNNKKRCRSNVPTDRFPIEDNRSRNRKHSDLLAEGIDNRRDRAMKSSSRPRSRRINRQHEDTVERREENIGQRPKQVSQSDIRISKGDASSPTHAKSRRRHGIDTDIHSRQTTADDQHESHPQIRSNHDVRRLHRSRRSRSRPRRSHSRSRDSNHSHRSHLSTNWQPAGRGSKLLVTGRYHGHDKSMQSFAQKVSNRRIRSSSRSNSCASSQIRSRGSKRRNISRRRSRSRNKKQVDRMFPTNQSKQSGNTIQNYGRSLSQGAHQQSRNEQDRAHHEHVIAVGSNDQQSFSNRLQAESSPYQQQHNFQYNHPQGHQQSYTSHGHSVHPHSLQSHSLVQSSPYQMHIHPAQSNNLLVQNLLNNYLLCGHPLDRNGYPTDMLVDPVAVHNQHVIMPIDRSKVCPFLLRVFHKLNGEYSLADFAVRGREPMQDELQIYTWTDAKLRELLNLIKDVSEETRDIDAHWTFTLIYPDRNGRNVMTEIGTIHSTKFNPYEDNKTLQSAKFKIGDYICLSTRVMKRRPGRGGMLRR